MRDEGRIYLISDDETLVPLRERPYDSEDLLQELLATYPDLLAGDQMSTTPRRWILIRREYKVPDDEAASGRWSLDHLFVDQDGIPTLVEVKRSSDTRLRRKVVAQMLDYAANGVAYWPIEELRLSFERTCHDREVSADEALASFLETRRDDEEAFRAFWADVEDHLASGTIRMVFVADVIPRELRRIVEFLNEQMSPAEVLAVEVKQYAGEGLRSLVPRVVGQTARAEQKKERRASRSWDRPSFLDALEQDSGATARRVASAVMDWAKERGLRHQWGSGSKDGSYYILFERDSQTVAEVSLWTYGKLEITFMTMDAPFEAPEQRLRLLRKLNEVDTIELTEDAIDRRPRIFLKQLGGEQVLQAFLDRLAWLSEEIGEKLEPPPPPASR